MESVQIALRFAPIPQSCGESQIHEFQKKPRSTQISRLTEESRYDGLGGGCSGSSREALKEGLADRTADIEPIEHANGGRTGLVWVGIPQGIRHRCL